MNDAVKDESGIGNRFHDDDVSPLSLSPLSLSAVSLYRLSSITVGVEKNWERRRKWQGIRLMNRGKKVVRSPFCLREEGKKESSELLPSAWTNVIP